jgi:catechol 2,3-dioxygenase-like lactoylglutathione lyase family enzyme
MSTAATAAPELLGIHHFTIRCAPGQLASVRDFYRDVLGMTTGPRPSFPFPGHWMYVGDLAVVHLAAISSDESPSGTATAPGFDHVSLHARGLQATRERLASLSVSYEEVPVPGWPLRQIFVQDPVGSKIELTFEVPQ